MQPFVDFNTIGLYFLPQKKWDGIWKLTNIIGFGRYDCKLSLGPPSCNVSNVAWFSVREAQRSFGSPHQRTLCFRHVSFGLMYRFPICPLTPSKRRVLTRWIPHFSVAQGFFIFYFFHIVLVFQRIHLLGYF